MSEARPSKTPARAGPQAQRRRVVWASMAVVALALVSWLAWANLTYPSDRTPEGAYLRIVTAVNRGRAQDFFAYLETPAQHACYTIRDYRRRARDRVSAAYPEPERGKLLALYAAEAQAPDGSDVFALYAERRGWISRLRRDLSGVQSVERKGERATVVTARGTRYPMRIRPENGIFGLTLFTAELVAEAERAARDFSIIEKAAADYERAKHGPK